MGKKRGRKRTSTEKMMEALSKCDACACRNFPPEFLIGLRGAIDAGLSCEQIAAFFVLVTGWYKACDMLDGAALLRRASRLARVMAGDMEEESFVRKSKKKNRREDLLPLEQGEMRCRNSQ